MGERRTIETTMKPTNTRPGQTRPDRSTESEPTNRREKNQEEHAVEDLLGLVPEHRDQDDDDDNSNDDEDWMETISPLTAISLRARVGSGSPTYQQ